MKIMQVKDCPLCGKIIWNFKFPKIIDFSGGTLSISFRPRPYKMNEHGRHFWILENTTSRMRVAICKQCFETLTNEQVKQMYTDLIYTKLKQIENDKNLDEEKRYKLFNAVRGLEMFKWAGTEEEIVKYLEEVQSKKT